MWKKIFFGGAKAFANDASRIVGKEMTRMAKERNNEEYEKAMDELEYNDVPDAKEREFI